MKRTLISIREPQKIYSKPVKTQLLQYNFILDLMLFSGIIK